MAKGNAKNVEKREELDELVPMEQVPEKVEDASSNDKNDEFQGYCQEESSQLLNKNSRTTSNILRILEQKKAEKAMKDEAERKKKCSKTKSSPKASTTVPTPNLSQRAIKVPRRYLSGGDECGVKPLRVSFDDDNVPYEMGMLPPLFSQRKEKLLDMRITSDSSSEDNKKEESGDSAGFFEISKMYESGDLKEEVLKYLMEFMTNQQKLDMLEESLATNLEEIGGSELVERFKVEQEKRRMDEHQSISLEKAENIVCTKCGDMSYSSTYPHDDLQSFICENCVDIPEADEVFTELDPSPEPEKDSRKHFQLMGPPDLTPKKYRSSSSAHAAFLKRKQMESDIPGSSTPKRSRFSEEYTQMAKDAFAKTLKKRTEQAFQDERSEMPVFRIVKAPAVDLQDLKEFRSIFMEYRNASLIPEKFRIQDDIIKS